VSGGESTLLSAGQAAISAGRWSDAHAAFQKVLEQTEDGDALFGIGIASFWLGETVAALRYWKRAYVVLRRAARHQEAAFAAIYMCLAYRMSIGNDVAARGWLGRATRIVTTHELQEMQGWLLLCRAHAAIDTGHPRAAEASAREAVALARTFEDVDLELCALSELGAAIVEQGRVEEGTALLDEAMAGALAGEARDHDSVVLISCRTITACSRGGDLRRATQWVNAADDFYRRFGSPHLYTTCRTHYAGILLATGRWQEAERELDAALRIGEAAEPALHAEARAKLAELRVGQGRVEEAQRLLDGYEHYPTTALATALVLIATGQPSAAVMRLRRRLREIDARSLEAATLEELLAEAEVALGKLDAARKRAEALAGSATTGVTAVVRARGERAIGRSLAGRPDVAEAITHYETAASIFERCGMPVESGRTHLLIAEALAATDHDAAIAEARMAFATFEQVGAVRHADRAAALVRALGARVPRGGQRGMDLLTRREREVLALLGEGLSNPEIARRLFITRKTVEHHVANVLGKVGLSGRAEAAAYAAREMARDTVAK
jgi:DNA-binding CsgD family transcriptional regulator/tetratricopeptide (TPR) repeat protein